MSIDNMQIITILLNILNNAFIVLFIFNLLKVNHLNPIVLPLVRFYKLTFGRIYLIPNQLLNIFLLAVLSKLISIGLIFSDQYDLTVLFMVSIIQTLMTSLRLIFFAVIGGVILSWVSQNNSNPGLQLIEEVSHKIQSPIRRYIPSAGGLDFSPIFVIIFINLAQNLLTDILRSIV